jgi:hypothetical protein
MSCDKCNDPECDVTPEGKPLPYVLPRSQVEPYDDEVVVTVTSTLGSYCGEFIASRCSLPALVEINKSTEGANYFHWQQ